MKMVITENGRSGPLSRVVVLVPVVLVPFPVVLVPNILMPLNSILKTEIDRPRARPAGGSDPAHAGARPAVHPSDRGQ